MSDADDWIAALPEPRRSDIAAIDTRIRAVAPGLRRYVERGFLAYGRYHYIGASKREGDWFVLGVASNKAYISLYASPVGVEQWADRLPKANLGRGCIRFKRTADLDLDVIDEVIAALDELEETFDKAKLAAEIEVYQAAHGWCPPDTQVYNEPAAEKAWSRLLALYKKTLA